MIANVSPSVTTFDDTYNTLKYANRAKNIKTQVTRNVLNAQYHISNYNQIITNLKNEISQLKTQLSKKDGGNLHSNTSMLNLEKLPIPLGINTNLNKIDLRKDDSKDNKPSPPSQPSSTPSNFLLFFDKCVADLKSLLEEEIKLKTKLLDQEHEIITLNTQISQIKNSDENFHTTQNNPKEIRLLTAPNKEDEFSTLYNKEKENLIYNNSVINQSSSHNTNTEVNLDYSNVNNTNNLLKEKEFFLEKFQKNFERNFLRISEMQKKRDVMLNIFQKNGVKDFYFDYLKSLVKSHNLKIFILENKFKEKFSNFISEIKENYIGNLENQLKFRDEMVTKNKVEFLSDESEKLKNVMQMKKDFQSKLPKVKNLIVNQEKINFFTFSRKDVEFSEIDRNSSNIYSSNLPPINSSTVTNMNNLTNLNSILSDVKNINNNILKLENNYKKKEKNKMNNNNIIKIEPYNSNTSNYSNNPGSNNITNLTKLNHARNYSQGIRNINIGLNTCNPTNMNLNSYNNYNGNNINYLGAPLQQNLVGNNHGNYSSNQRMQVIEQISSSKNLRKLKTNIIFPNNNINNNSKFLHKEINSDKSFSNNQNNISDNDVYMVDMDNSADESENNLKRINRNISGITGKDRKVSAQPNIAGNHITIKDEVQPSHSPMRKEFLKYNSNNLNKRDESLTKIDVIQNVKKKDLNMFLNEKSKSKNHRKIPFK